MELLQLRYFATVAQMLNISQAAKHHMIPQPAMSRTISKLESELGVSLFDRYKNRLTLTDAGKAFYQQVSLSLWELDKGVEELGRTDAQPSGQLRILVQQHRDTVVDCIMAFKKLYPKVSFQISYETKPTDYQQYDLCIAGDQPDESFSGRQCLITETLKLVVSRDHWTADAQQIPFGALSAEEFAIVSPNSNQWIQTLMQCRQAGFEPKVSITCSDLHCLMKYINAAMAITVGPEIAWQGLNVENAVFIPTVPKITRSTYVFWNPHKSASRLSGLYREFLVTYFKDLS